ncbi:hypothetical protein E6V79_21200 [Salmonella enterica]|nr:hypothetical protein [Salmonella enterica]EAV5401620.1 hypothetical protein [Salmonella enterica]
MVMKHEGRGEGFCCRYASAGRLIGWFMYGEDTQNVIFVASSDSGDFVQAINKATADLQERLAMDKEFLNCMLNAMKNYSDRSAPELRGEQLEKEKSYSRLDSLILFPDEKLVMASEVNKYLKKMANERGGYLNNCNIKKILSLAIETVTEE